MSISTTTKNTKCTEHVNLIGDKVLMKRKFEKNISPPPYWGPCDILKVMSYDSVCFRVKAHRN
jgi:hypothetical protein